MQIFRQAIQFRIANCGFISSDQSHSMDDITVASIQEWQQVKKSQRREEFVIQLPHQSLLIDPRRIRERFIGNKRWSFTWTSLILECDFLVFWRRGGHLGRQLVKGHCFSSLWGTTVLSRETIYIYIYISLFRFYKRKKKRHVVKIRDTADSYNFKPVDDDLNLHVRMFLHPVILAYHV